MFTFKLFSFYDTTASAHDGLSAPEKLQPPHHAFLYPGREALRHLVRPQPGTVHHGGRTRLQPAPPRLYISVKLTPPFRSKLTPTLPARRAAAPSPRPRAPPAPAVPLTQNP